MQETELKAIVQSQIGSSMGYMGGELSKERAKSMDYYLGEPFGNEMEGRSQVVSRDVLETVEWMLPSLIRIFTSGDQAVEFEPVSPEDEPAAKQETEYCNYVFYRRNEGFLLFYTWFKDALLQKNGIIKNYCDKKEENTREEYQGLTSDEFAMLLADPELEPTEHTERMYTGELPGPDGMLMPVQYPVHDVVFRRKRESHDYVIDALPPEEFLISRGANSPNPKKANFTCHRSKKTLSELREMGYDKKTLDRIPSENLVNTEQEAVSRRHLSDEEDFDAGEMDKSMREVWVYECYIKIDYDDDGIAELRKVTIAGNEILENEETDRVPFCSLTPVILTHKFYGLSVADLVDDLQLIKSTLWRQILDNLYLNNNAMMGADANNVNLDDLLTRRPGGNIRTNGPPQNSLMPIIFPPVPAEAFAMMEYLDVVKETRTGVGKQFQGLNADTLKEANIPAVQGLLSAAQQRVEMIARIFAETGVKQLFMDLHELIRKYPNKPEVVKLTNNWVTVDPREWRERKNMTVSVGLGSASKDQQLIAINSVIQDQTMAVQGGLMGVLVTPENIHKALVKKAEINGFKNGSEFWTDPSKVQQQPPKPDPQMAAIQAQMQIEQAKNQVEQAKLQLETQKAQQGFEIETMRLQIEQLKLQQKAQSDNDKNAITASNNDVQAQLASLQLALEQKQADADRMAELAIKLDQLDMDKYQVDRKAEIDLILAHINEQSQIMNTQIQARHKESLQINANALTGAKNELKQEVRAAFGDVKSILSEAKKPDTAELEVELDDQGKVLSVGGKKIKRKKK